MLKALMSHKLVVAVGGAVLVALLALLVAAGIGKLGKPDTAPDPRAARGYTDTVTSPVYSPNQPRPSMPRPAVLPPMIKSEGQCKAAMDAIRDFQDANPSGLVLPAAAAEKLTVLLHDLGPSTEAKCTDVLSQRFRLQELDPWLSWRPTTPGEPAPHDAAKPSPPTTSPATPAPSSPASSN